MYRHMARICIITATLMLIGCGGSGSPTTPDLGTPPEATPPGLTSGREVQASDTAHYLMGYFMVYVDPVALEFEIIPVRTATGHWNALAWLEQWPCTDCFQLLSLQGMPDGKLLADVQITHPFDGLNFTAFDVRGITMFDGNHEFPLAGLITSDLNLGDGELLNPDGHTTLYNYTTEGSGFEGRQGYIKGNLATPTAPNATLNGYKVFITDDPGNTRNALYAGDSVVVSYEFDKPDSGFIFGYAIDSNWAEPIIKPVTDPMAHFPPEANCPEPWKIEVTEDPVGQGLTDQGGSTVLTIDAYDREGKATLLDPVVECPELFDTAPTAAWIEDGDGYSRFEVTIGNQLLAPQGEYMVLIGIEATENAGAPEWMDLTAYAIYKVTVGEFVPMDPIASANADPIPQIICEDVHFFDDGSSDPDGGSIVTYEWDWDNDGVYDEVGDDVYHTWDVPGTYYVQFRVTDDEGATDELDAPLEIVMENGIPLAIAIPSTLNALVGEEIEFDGSNSVDGDCMGEEIVEWEWDWENDGTYDETGEIINHAYDEEGTYKVMLRVTDNEGATGELHFPLEIYVAMEYFDPVAQADAEPNPQTVCEPVHFFDDGSYDPDGGDIFLYEWDWDNDGVYDEEGDDITHTWDVPGVYYVQFHVKDDEGVIDDLDDPLEIVIENALPTAVAEADKYNAYVGEDIVFSAAGSYDNDCQGEEIVLCEWEWDNDGIYDESGETAIHSYDAEGVFQVQLRVTDDEGGTDTLDEPLEINVSTELFDPVAVAEADPVPQTVCEPVHFVDNGSYDPDGGLIELYEWDWDNDGVYDETGSDVYHNWDVPGTYYVQFRVTDDEGATGELADPLEIIIENALPTASAQADDYDVYVDEQINFDGSASTDNDCGGEAIVLYEWDWESDGIFDETGPTATHSYLSQGIYYVQLRVTDNEGDTVTLDEPLEITVSIEYFDPVALAYLSPNPGIVCQTIYGYDNGSYDPDGGTIEQYEWDWDNDGIYDATGPEANNAWDVPGTYYVQFRVTDDEGATDELDEPIELIIENALPTAVAEADDYDVYEGVEVNFDASESYDNDCDGEMIVEWEWDWENDGIFDETGVTASHSYGSAGVYLVQLRVTDDEGGWAVLADPLQITVTVEPLDPIAFAMADPVPQTICEPVHLFDNGSYDPDGGTIELYEWDLDNDGVYDEVGDDIYHAWDVPGTYYVQFRVTDDEGATDELDEPLEIVAENALPTAVAEVSAWIVEVGELVDFDASGSHDNDCSGQEIVLCEWDWNNDGVYDETGVLVQHSFDDEGDFYVQLRVTDDEGTTDILEESIHIIAYIDYTNPVAIAVAEPNPQTICEAVHFHDNGSFDPDGGNITLYEWDWNNDGTYDETGTDIYRPYSIPGTYYVQFRVTDDEGATDELDAPLEIVIENALPTALALANKDIAIIDELIIFDASASHDNDCGNQSIVLYEWDWENDGIFDDTGVTMNHSYSAEGVYYVQLRVTDNEGATDLLDEPLEITINPELFDPVAQADFDPVPQTVCELVHFFDAGSYDPDGGIIILYEWDWDDDGAYDEMGPDVYHSWDVPGVYYVQFRVTDDEGAMDTLDEPLMVIIENTQPTAVAEASTYDAFVDELIDFDGTGSYDNDCSGAAIVLYEWDWDNDGVYDETGPMLSHSFDSPGLHRVQLQVTDDEDATDKLDEPLEITVTIDYKDPIAMADADPNPQTVCDFVHFFDAGSYDPDGGFIVMYEWDWDNDGVYDEMGPDVFHAWDIPGTYYVQFRVTDDEGATDELDAPLEIVIENALPTAVGEATQYSVYTGDPIFFSGVDSYDNDCDGEMIVEWEWDWESDGIYDETGAMVEHTFYDEGVYNVQLRVTDDEATTDMLDDPLVITVTFLPLDPVAQADFDPVPQTVCELVHFFDAGSYDPDGGIIILYEWDWDNDGIYDEVGADVYHSWDEPGFYNVQFRVTDDEGAMDELDEPLMVIIENAQPTAVAEASTYDAFVDELIDFDGTGSYDNDCSGAAIVLYEWDWDNDGVYDETGPMLSHSFDSPGLHRVQLQVTDDEDATDKLDEPLEITVTIDYKDPIAIADADPNPQTVCDLVHFFDSGSYDPDGGFIVLYEWDWDNDGVYDEMGPDVFHAWDIPGTYYVQFRVTDDEDATDELDAPLEIVIENALPTAVGEATQYSVYTGDPIIFSGVDSYDNDCDGEMIVEWEWDWESDGIYDETGAVVEHTFYDEGVYNVQLRVTDDEATTDTLDDPLVITVTFLPLDPVAQADFDPNPQTVCEPVHFYDDGSWDPDGGSIVVYEWDWDNDGIYDEVGADVYHSWDEPGFYYVQFRVTDDEGAMDTLDEPLMVIIENALPTAVAEASTYEAFVDELIDFDGTGSYDNDCSGAAIVLYEWDWDNDGVYDETGPMLSHSFDSPGLHRVQLQVTDDEDATDKLDEPLEIVVI